MQPLLFCCCGVDVHDKMIEACILKGLTDEPELIRKQFSTLPHELKNFAQWLTDNECYHIAMESTGVYWRPIYEAIEDHSQYFEHIVVTNANHMKNLPGRKSDADDAEWIATLLRHGLLSSSFVPARIFRDMREASRLYKKFVAERCRYVNRIEKFLQAHGFKLSHVLSDILCVSGRNILSILAQRGSLSAADVAECLRGRTKHSPEEIHSAISGSLNDHERKLLSILLDRIDNAQTDVNVALDFIAEMALPYQKEREQLDSIPGIDTTVALLILAEISNTPHLNFDSAEKLCSWAGLSPRNDESAGKVKSRKIMPGNPYIKSILCQSAWAAVSNRKNPFGQWFWSHQGKLGKKKAIIAVSRKILTVAYVLLRDGTFYDSDIHNGNLHKAIG